MSDDEKKKKSMKSKMKDANETYVSKWRSPVRQILFELVFAMAVTLAFGIPLALGSSFLGLLSTGLVFAGLGAVVSLGVGIVGNPLTTLALCVIHLIDGDLRDEDSKGWFFGKSLIKAIVSGGGAALAGLLLQGVIGSTLPSTLLPANVLPGSNGWTGFTVWLITLFYYHVSILLAIHTDDGFPMILLTGLSQFAFGVLTWAIWQVVPNLNYLFLVTVAVEGWSTDASWELLIEAGAVILTVLFYYIFFRDVFSMKSRINHQNESIADEASLLMDRGVDGTMRSAAHLRKW